MTNLKKLQLQLFAEPNGSNKDADPTNEDYIEAIKQIQENSVSKEEYAKLKDENKKLLNSLVRGETIKVEIPKADTKELQNKLFNQELNNLDFVTTALELRKVLISEGKPDPFLPIGSQIIPTQSDVDAAKRVAEALESCVEYADGNSAVFTNELQRITVDTSPRKRK